MINTYPDFVDTFQYADNASINGLVSESGHEWLGSGVNTPDIISNTLQSGGGVAGSGNYAFVDVLAQPDYQYCDFVIDVSSTDNHGVVLMTSPQFASLVNMTHIRFTKLSVFLEMRSYTFGNTNVVAAIPDIQNTTITYSSPLVQGVSYRVGVKYYKDSMGIILPDGSERIISSYAAKHLVNRYLCFQPLNSILSKAGCTIKTRNTVRK